MTAATRLAVVVLEYELDEDCGDSTLGLAVREAVTKLDSVPGATLQPLAHAAIRGAAEDILRLFGPPNSRVERGPS